MVYICKMSDCIVGLRFRVMALILLFLSSPLALKRDIAVTILLRCANVRACVRPDLFGP